jgi:hypothetical protein
MDVRIGLAQPPKRRESHVPDDSSANSTYSPNASLGPIPGMQFSHDEGRVRREQSGAG